MFRQRFLNSLTLPAKVGWAPPSPASGRGVLLNFFDLPIFEFNRRWPAENTYCNLDA
jgi:hypothetical protein